MLCCGGRIYLYTTANCPSNFTRCGLPPDYFSDTSPRLFIAYSVQMRSVRQVQGLNTEYERLRKESEGKGPGNGGSSAASEGPTSLQGLRKEVQSLQVPFSKHRR